MNELTEELIQVAATVAVGCTSCLEYHVPKARELGARHADLQEILALVRQVQLIATMRADDFAEDMFRSRKKELNVVTEGSSCGCGSGSCCS
ncbi:carboxymuconolactone decarboxylase family protein [Alicyclobacillus sp. SO9]|uniref:carboxymuconolactone decarboxylase family protein n=1 Tax=Alicyclobacillus sp. SO9 TaxID=2665646 RepID=UPI0018E7459C|nr:carboxymuconolactone decarboxylase family protein [Alicyclobacillus sp. SO9]QQE81586.1 carboxymuconolactone decarboxylase family protein [Alicyclobacillus sp. SO9]